MSTLQVVWFKRDLRIRDHDALFLAAQNGPVLPLYILEPDLWQQQDMAGRHYDFLCESVADLNDHLTQIGRPLVIRIGDAIEVLNTIHHETGFTRLLSHQETWNDWTYQRDRRVGAWARENGIIWDEPSQFGVVRGLRSRTGWASLWNRQMALPMKPAPERIDGTGTQSLSTQPLPTKHDLGLADDFCPHRQMGTHEAGLAELTGFLEERGAPYQKAMSSPVTAFQSCSRLSPYLSFGLISMRETYQMALRRRTEIMAQDTKHRGKWSGALKAFLSRLHWHCHFIQKLEDEPAIEFRNFHSAYDGLREADFDNEKFAAWKAGMTGYPIVDASMRALHAHGWINFRMRAMLVSFASYHLWLHWRETGLYLARHFTDYEPGIHYSQMQMQSGTTGINTVRIYSPVKQGMDQDPDGLFIKRWVPELSHVPAEFLHKPEYLREHAPNYSRPIVHEKAARKAASNRVYALRRGIEHREEAQLIIEKHGSRKAGLDQSFRDQNRKRTERSGNTDQGELPL